MQYRPFRCLFFIQLTETDSALSPSTSPTLPDVNALSLIPFREGISETGSHLRANALFEDASMGHSMTVATFRIESFGEYGAVPHCTVQ